MGAELKEKFEEKLNADTEDVTIEAVKLLATDDENIDLKTNIPSPLHISLIDAISEMLEARLGGCDDECDKDCDRYHSESAQFLRTIVERFKRYQISKGGKGRKEIIESFEHLSNVQSEDTKLAHELAKRR